MGEPIAPEALDLIKSFEGCLKPVAGGLLAPYLCPANVATVGWGSTYYEGHRKVTLKDPPITKERAGQLLNVQLASEYAPSVDKNVKVALHPLSRGASVSLAYNIGGAAFAKSTALRMINQRRWSEVPRAFRMYRMGGGRVLSGLERRRIAEAAMFMAGVKAMQTGSVAAPVASVTPLLKNSSEVQPSTIVEGAQQQPTSRWSRFLSMFGRAA
jgi:lysozyme